MHADVVIVGGGVLGLTAAFELARAGIRNIQLIDEGSFSNGATSKSAAMVRTNCISIEDTRLATHSLNRYVNWGQEVGGECGYKKTGLIHILPAMTEERTFNCIQLYQRLGVRVEANHKSQMRLQRDAETHLYFPDAGYCDPQLTLASLRDALCYMGISFVYGDKVVGVKTTKKRVESLVTKNRNISGGTFLLAAGIGTPRLLPKSRVLDLTFKRRISRVCEVSFGSRKDEMPIILDDVENCWFRPTGNHQVLVGAERGGQTCDDDSSILSLTVPADVHSEYLKLSSKRLSIPSDGIVRSWAGIFSLSPDSKPIVGHFPEWENLLIAAGDSGVSFKFAPAIGQGLAELITQPKQRSVDISSLNPMRFYNPPIATNLSAQSV